MAEYTMSIRTRGSLAEQITFSSDNVFKDVAEKISQIPLDAYPNGCTVVVENNYGDTEEFWLVNKRDGTHFIRYGMKYNPVFEDSIDWDLEPRYLTCLDEESNEYKYYLMNFNRVTRQCEVQYGRIGHKAGEFVYDAGNASKDGSFEYPAQMFWIKYYEKIAKGYVDRTEEKDFNRVSRKAEAVYKPIEETEISRIMETLIKKQRDYVYQKFDMSVPASSKAIEKAEELLANMESLAGQSDISDRSKRQMLESTYRELVVTLPRKITNVYEYIRRFSLDAKADNAIGKILEEERELLNNFRDVYLREHEGEQAVNSPEQTVLEANGLSSERPSFFTQWDIEDRLEDESHYVSRVLEVRNDKTTQRYEACKKQKGIEERGCHLFFHGSRTENWWSIFKNGLSLNPKATITGKMFGQGLYFASLARKSLGYTDFRGSYWARGGERYGYLALFEVAMGKPYEPHHAFWSHFRESDLRQGYHSVWAKPSKTGLRNEECIVYNEGQCNIKYLIEMDANREPFRSFDPKKVRAVSCEGVTYDKNTDTLRAKSNLGLYLTWSPDNKYYNLVYDCKNDTLSAEGLYLSKQEEEYLKDVFQSNYADSPTFFKEWLAEFKEKSLTKEAQMNR